MSDIFYCADCGKTKIKRGGYSFNGLCWACFARTIRTILDKLGDDEQEKEIINGLYYEQLQIKLKSEK